MLTYTFSRREKFLICVLSFLMIAVLWYKLVYESTTQQLQELQNQIETADTDLQIERARLKKQDEMKKAIVRHETAGDRKVRIPDFNNLRPLMSELDGIMSAAQSYTLEFDELDTESSEYILRGVRVKFGCESYKKAMRIISSIAEGSYPCVIEDLNVNNSTSSYTFRSDSPIVNADAHVIFYERPKDKQSTNVADASQTTPDVATEG